MPTPTKSSNPKVKTAPRTINVLGISVDVIKDTKKLDERSPEEKNFGETVTEDQCMLIRDDLRYDSESDVVLHELGHWMFYLSGASQFFSVKQEERFIHSYTTVLLDTLRRNKDLRDYLFGE